MQTQRKPNTPKGNGVLEQYKYATVSTSVKSARQLLGEKLDKSATYVHLTGHPFLWAFEEVLGICTNLKVIEINPFFEHMASGARQRLCLERGVEIKVGYFNPNCACSREQNRSSIYKRRRAFMLNLKPHQQELFDELLALGFKEAFVVQRYFCLKNEPYISQSKAARECGLQGGINMISRKISAVLHYLDPMFERKGKRVLRVSRIKSRVKRIRLEKQKKSERDKIILAIRLSGGGNGLKELRGGHPRCYEAIVLRYGINDGQPRTLKEVGTLMTGGFGKNRGQLSPCQVHYLITEAFRYLRINV